MYLKRIKLQGFKSFANKVNIDFNEGITGVVGPNGSGKSNIVDAIRWVLGEQSIKSLRGEHGMTDVIFSGSTSRKPLNSASVTLIFDNTNNYLPLNFNEVAIKRVVFRDGSNEYFINNEQCRLKDITNLMLDTGVSKESLNIISQGDIESIILSKPIERRVFFEEAAGVLKYKKRKEETIRKLEKTHLNMERINDIINEITNQLQPLEKQKELAVKYLETKEEVKKLDIAIMGLDIKRINDEYETGQKEISTLKSNVIELETKITANEILLEGKREELSLLEKELLSIQQQLLEQTTLVGQIESQKQIVFERTKYEVDDLKLHDNLVNLKEETFKLDNLIVKLDEELNNKTKQLNVVKEKMDVLNNDFNILRDNKRKIEIQLANKLREEQYLKIKIEQLKNSIDNNSKMPLAVAKVLNNKKLNGICDVLSNIIEVSEEYSLAITTSLGQSLSNIVVENEHCAKEAITYLKDNKLGRVTFFPLNIIKPRGIDNNTFEKLKTIPGYINIGADLIKFDAKYYNIIHNQLGNVIIVDNMTSANKISKAIFYRYRIVTLDGELLNVGGSITGGSQFGYKNVIMDKYELEKQVVNLNNLINVIKDFEEQINELDHNLGLQEENIYILKKEKINLETIINNLRRELEDIKNKKRNVTEEIMGTSNIIKQSLSEEEDKILKQYYEELKNKEQLNNRLESLLLNKEQLLDVVEGIEIKLKTKRKSLFAENKQVNNLEIKISRLDVQLENLLNLLSQSYNITYEGALKYELDISYNEASEKLNKLKQILQEIGMVNLDAPNLYEEVKERYDFLAEQENDLIQSETTLLTIIKEMDEIMEEEFAKTFNLIATNFKITFKELFQGGEAILKLTDNNNLLETGIEIIVSPPGKKLTSISLLSGGEKTLTAISLLFAILKSTKVPYCVLDEIEAALDEVNVDNFGKYLRKLKEKTQFILITHKKKTMEYVDVLYGITMEESGVSKLVSVKLK